MALTLSTEPATSFITVDELMRVYRHHEPLIAALEQLVADETALATAVRTQGDTEWAQECRRRADDLRALITRYR